MEDNMLHLNTLIEAIMMGKGTPQLCSLPVKNADGLSLTTGMGGTLLSLQSACSVSSLGISPFLAGSARGTQGQTSFHPPTGTAPRMFSSTLGLYYHCIFLSLFFDIGPSASSNQTCVNSNPTQSKPPFMAGDQQVIECQYSTYLTQYLLGCQPTPDSGTAAFYQCGKWSSDIAARSICTNVSPNSKHRCFASGLFLNSLC